MKTIELTQNQAALVDDEDFEWLSRWKWYALWDNCTKSFYAARTAPRPDGKRRHVYMHRSILGLGPGELGDHKDRDSLNNQRFNLRRCTKSQNNANGKRQRNNTSGYKGVCWHKRHNKWYAGIRYQGKRIYLGAFKRVEDAACAYNDAARKYFGEFASLNEIISERSILQTAHALRFGTGQIGSETM